YSWRGKDKKLRESVTIPTKRESSPIFDRAFICCSIPSFWSRNHQPVPYCIFPGNEPSLKFPVIVATSTFPDCVLFNRTVVANYTELSRPLRQRDIDTACEKSPIESKPVSGPSSRIIRVLLLRRAPRWNCCAQPFA